MRKVEVQHLLNLREVVEDRYIIQVTAGCEAEPLILSLKQPPDMRQKAPSGRSFFKKWADQPNSFRVHYLKDGNLVTFDLPDTTENLTDVQSFGSDKWLLVRGRAENELDKNAHIYTFKGKLRSFYAGDDIDDVQTSNNGKIWINFGDEAINGFKKLGIWGLICLNEYGEVVITPKDILQQVDHKLKYRVGSITTKETDPLKHEAIEQSKPYFFDMNTINVYPDDEIWIYCWMYGSLIDYFNEKVTYHFEGFKVFEPRAISISRNRVFLWEGERKSKIILQNHIWMIPLDTMQAEELEPIDNNGNRIEFRHCFARSSRMFFVTDDELYNLDLAALEV